MTDVERIAKQIEDAYRKGFWGGGSIGELFQSLSAQDALAKPIPEAHSTWEIALHLDVWHGIFRGRVTGEDTEHTLTTDWPEPIGLTDERWRGTLSELELGVELLAGAVRDMDSDRLHTAVRDRNFTMYEMLHGIPQHDLYHAGQVMMLKKALRGSTG